MDLDLDHDAGETCLGGGMHCPTASTLCPKNVHLFILHITLSKIK